MPPMAPQRNNPTPEVAIPKSDAPAGNERGAAGPAQRTTALLADHAGEFLRRRGGDPGGRNSACRAR